MASATAMPDLTAGPMPSPDQSWRGPRHRRPGRRPGRHILLAADIVGVAAAVPGARSATRPRLTSLSCSRRQCGPMASPLAFSSAPWRRRRRSDGRRPWARTSYSRAGRARRTTGGRCRPPVVGELLLEHGGLLAGLARGDLAEEGTMDGATRPAGADQMPAAILSSITYQSSSRRIGAHVVRYHRAAGRCSSHASNSIRRIECCLVLRLSPGP